MLRPTSATFWDRKRGQRSQQQPEAPVHQVQTSRCKIKKFLSSEQVGSVSMGDGQGFEVKVRVGAIDEITISG
ncbi:hypothetical protein L1887_31575 [Cichorium endivia]|nr:hypothetical protein L1887_31575 [Cichorium endivia]